MDLEHDVCLAESGAIVRYLVNSRKIESPLYPVADLKRRVMIDRYLEWSIGELRQAASGLYVRKMLLPVFLGINSRESEIRQAEDKLREVLDKLDQIMGQAAEVDSSPYLVKGG